MSEIAKLDMGYPLIANFEDWNVRLGIQQMLKRYTV